VSDHAGAAIELSEAERAALGKVLALLEQDRAAPSAVRDPRKAWRVHVADSLTGLQIDGLASARRIGDVGSGAGFPGIVLAIALAPARVDLIESLGRKCQFMRRVIAATGISNARVVCERAETWALAPPPRGGRGAYEAVTVRAVGRLATVAELASPLLAEGGVLVAWKGRRNAAEEAELDRASDRLAMKPVSVSWVGPYAGSEHRHLHVLVKSGPTPPGLPRRPGMAKKRPFGAS
jgi:16S rRNA (guanine527-N7)-methyltransferase